MPCDVWPVIVRARGVSAYEVFMEECAHSLLSWASLLLFSGSHSFSLSLSPSPSILPPAVSCGYWRVTQFSYGCRVLCVEHVVAMATVYISNAAPFLSVSSLRAEVGVQERLDSMLCDCCLSSSFSLAYLHTRSNKASLQIESNLGCSTPTISANK